MQPILGLIPTVFGGGIDGLAEHCSHCGKSVWKIVTILVEDCYAKTVGRTEV